MKHIKPLGQYAAEHKDKVREVDPKALEKANGQMRKALRKSKAERHLAEKKRVRSDFDGLTAPPPLP